MQARHQGDEEWFLRFIQNTYDIVHQNISHWWFSSIRQMAKNIMQSLSSFVGLYSTITSLVLFTTRADLGYINI